MLVSRRSVLLLFASPLALSACTTPGGSDTTPSQIVTALLTGLQTLSSLLPSLHLPQTVVADIQNALKILQQAASSTISQSTVQNILQAMSPILSVLGGMPGLPQQIQVILAAIISVLPTLSSAFGLPTSKAARPLMSVPTAIAVLEGK